MKNREMTRIVYVMAAAFVFALLPLMAAACGDSGAVAGGTGPFNTSGGSTASTSTSSPGAGMACDKTAPSIIPRPSGRPQLVYFFRDT